MKLLNDKEGLFNERQKLEYLEQLKSEGAGDSYVDASEAVLKKASFYEYLLNKDVADFQKIEVINLFEGLKWSSHYSTFATNRTILQKYTEWYKKAKALVFETLRFEDLGAELDLALNYYKDIFDLKKKVDYMYRQGDERLEEYCPPEILSKNLFSSMHKTALFLLWYGFSEEEIINLKIKDVDIKNDIVKSSISDYSIALSSMPKEVSEIIINTSNMRSAYVLVRNGIRLMDYNASEYLIRRFVIGERSSSKDVRNVNVFKNIREKLFRARVDLDENDMYKKSQISFKNVYRSGSFYRMYILEKQGIDLSENKFEAVKKSTRGNTSTYFYSKLNGEKLETGWAREYFSYLKWKFFYYNE